MPLGHRRTLRVRGGLALLACALLLLQTLALLHGMRHPHAGSWRTPAASSAAAGLAGDLLHHDDGSPVCRLIDHCAQPDALLPALPALDAPAVAFAAPPAAPAGRLHPAGIPYDARGPPALIAL